MMKSSEPATAVEFLTKAGNLLIERAAQYDQPGGERSMGKTVDAFNAITGRTLSEAEGWLLLQLLKDVRQWQTPDKLHRDSAEDCVSYAALKAEALVRGSAEKVVHPGNCDHVWEGWPVSINEGMDWCQKCGAKRPTTAPAFDEVCPNIPGKCSLVWMGRDGMQSCTNCRAMIPVATAQAEE